MPRHSLSPPPSAGSADEVEAQFYDALQQCDIDLLMRCWAEDQGIVCVHPGGMRLMGVAAIRHAFEGVFANGSIAIRPTRVRVIDTGLSSMHSVVEAIDIMTADGPHRACVIATNLYHKTELGWRMVLHHASPGSAQALQEVGDAPAMLH